MAALTMLAAVIRVAMVLSTVDAPGDGPVKALMAYYWAQAPHLVLQGIWLPGFLYLTGLVSAVLPMWIAARLFNVLLGVATVPVFFLAVSRVFGPTTGIIAAAWMAVFPLHVELSASSLTEVSALFEILLGLTTLIMATHGSRLRRGACAALSMGSLVMASMTRYEAWLLLPLFPAYYWLRTRDGRAAMGMAVVLAAFPVAWMAGNHIVEGHALLGVNAAIHDRSFATRELGVSPIGAVEILVRQFAAYLGWILLVLLGLGLMMEIRSWMARRLVAERMLYLGVALTSLAGLAVFTVLRGETVVSRYFLLSFAFVVPIAVRPMAPYLSRIGRRGFAVVVALTLLHTLGSVAFTGRPETVWVTTVQPQSMVRFAEWMNQSPWREGAVAFTRMDWQPTYLPYYFPTFAWRIVIVSEWIDDGRLDALTRTVRPALLVTQRGDEAYVSRFGKVTGLVVDEDRLVHRDGGVHVYELTTAHGDPPRAPPAP